MTPRTRDLCTFFRDGVWCGRLEADETVHVWPDERMRPGRHVWRHDAKDAPRLEAALAEPQRELIGRRSDEYRQGYQAGYQAGRIARRASVR